MKRIQWNDDLTVGVYMIDKQHRDLVDIINAIAEVLDTDVDKKTLSGIIRRFYDFTTTHFQAEEALMDHETYPEYFDQVRQHLDCSMKALEFHRRFSDGDRFDLHEFHAFVSGWFLEHTSGIDKSLAQHLMQKA